MSVPTLRLVEEAAQPAKRKTETKRAATKPKPSKHTDAPTAQGSGKKKAGGRPPAKTKRDVTASDLMSTSPVCCRATDTLNIAAQLLWEHDVGAVVVVDDEHRPQSVLTDRDICFAAYTQGVPLWSTHVETAMAKKLSFCTADTPIATVRQLLREARVRRLPVVDNDGKLVGLIGFKDLADEASQPLDKSRKRGSTAADLLQLLAGVLSPPGPSAEPAPAE